MVPRILVFTTAAALLGLIALRAENFDQALDQAAADYKQRLTAAADDLNRTRARVAAEKAPWLEQIRAAENRILLAERDAMRTDTGRELTAEQRRKLLLDLDSIRKTTSYVGTLAHDGLKAATDGLAPGEDQFVGETIKQLQEKLDSESGARGGTAALEVVDFLLSQTERQLGGYRGAGVATLSDTNQVVDGMFAFVGPETFFCPNQGAAAGTVRPREGAKFPVSFALPAWRADEATRFFAGQPGTVLADASSGKALRLRETTGTVWDHIKKGGVVAFAILGVGLLAAIMIVQKMRDVLRMGLDTPENVQRVLDSVARGAFSEAESAAKTLQRSVRELFFVGLRYVDQPKPILEEQLEAVLLDARLHYERRLPLLAVIATAAPLMGLLGTVVGMVRTFALITVFGTGNAAKLSSGISEVLVATELGLTVAIPTLVVHGFLAHRIQKNLSQLERYALKFCTAAEMAKRPAEQRTSKESITA